MDRRRARVGAVDRRLMRRLAATESVVLDQCLPRLSVAADYGGLWVGVAGGLALTGGRRARRAAARGLVGLAIASAVANIAGKGLVRRERPPTASVPTRRRLPRMPLSPSFPSGHSASAAAFATGVLVETPAVGVAVAGLAAAVAASRVVTGAHHPSDVVAGILLGIGGAAWTLNWWPRDPAAPRARRRRRHSSAAA